MNDKTERASNKKTDRFTFLLDEKEKTQFKELAEARNRNGSLLLRDFVRTYLSSPAEIEHMMRPAQE